MGTPSDNKSKLPSKEKVMDFFHALTSGTLIVSSLGLLGYFIFLVTSGTVKKERMEYLIREGIIRINDETNKEIDSHIGDGNHQQKINNK